MNIFFFAQKLVLQKFERIVFESTVDAQYESALKLWSKRQWLLINPELKPVYKSTQEWKKKLIKYALAHSQHSY
jgi:hypothetical protein